MSTTCKGITRTGDPCRRTYGISEDGFCAIHNSESANESPAKTNKSQVILPDLKDIPAPMKSAEDVPKWASWLAYAILTGQVDPKTGHEVSIAITSFQRGHDYSEGQKKVAELKKQLAEMKKDQNRNGR
jgi:hypothetical protein